MGQPRIEAVADEYRTSSTPSYAVDQADFSRVTAPGWITPNICIVDYDKAFFTKAPPLAGIHMLTSDDAFTAPEFLFELKANTPADVWALGCTIYEARAAEKPFHLMYHSEIHDDTLTVAWEIGQTLGKLPEAWSHVTCDIYGLPLDGFYDDMAVTYPLHEMVNEIVDEPPINLGSSTIASSTAKNYGANLFWQRPLSDLHRRFGSTKDEWDIVDTTQADVRLISPEEAESLCDLLSKILVYEPGQRISAQELTRHP